MADERLDEPLRERKKRRTREEILAAAMSLFRDSGYNKVTIEQIAAAADVSPRTVYHYFAAKEDLVLRYHARDLEVLLDHIRRAPARQSAIDILGSAEIWHQDAAGEIRMATRFEIMNSVPSLRRKLRDRRAAWAHAIAGALSERGHFGGDRSMALLFSRCLMSVTETAMEADPSPASDGHPLDRMRHLFAALRDGFEVLDRRP